MAISKADRIRELSKKWIETGDDGILDELKHLAHDGFDLSIRNRRILERYKNSRLDVHCHLIRVDGVRDVSSHDVCAVAKYCHRPDSGHDGLPVIEERNSWITSMDSGQVQHPMLIDVHEIVQNAEGVREAFHVPSLIRLQTLDNCLGLRMNPAETVSFNLSEKTVNRVTDRKLVFLDGSSIVDENELINDVIKSGSEIVQTVANDNAQLKIGIGEIGVGVKEGFFVRIFLDNHGAFILMPRDLGGYRCEVLFSPDDFLTNSVERMAHDEENPKDLKRS